MADDNKLSIEISANIDDLTAALTKAGYEVKKFGEEAEETGKKGVGSLTTELGTLMKSGLNTLSTVLGGAFTKFKQLFKATQDATQGMSALKSALISTGIGALVVALGYLIEHWDEINDAMSPTAGKIKEIQTRIEGLNGAIDVVDSKMDVLKEVLKYEESLGIASDATKKLMVEQLEVKGDLLRTTGEELKLKLANLKANAKELDWVTRTGNAILKFRGIKPIKIFDEVDADEQALIDEATALVNANTAAVVANQNAVAKYDGTADTSKAAKKTADDLVKKQAADAKAKAKQLEADAEYARKQLELNYKNSAALDKQTEEHNAKAVKAAHDYELEKQKVITDAEDERLDVLLANSQSELKAIAAGNEAELALLREYIQLNKDELLSFEEWKKTVQGISTATKLEGVAMELQAIQDMHNQFNAEMESIIGGGIEGMANALGEGIGGILAGEENAVKNMGLGVLASMGDFLSQMGGMLIKYGAMGIVMAKLGVTMGTPLGFAAGAAAIALGTVMTALGNAIGSVATGGISGGGSSSSSGSSASGSGSSDYSGGGSSYSSSSSSGGHFVFEIQGTKLIGVIRNTVARNKSMSGTEFSF